MWCIVAIREAIIEATIEEFNEKGIKFAMDDVAKRLAISKKTIYKFFNDKETLFLNIIDYCFDTIEDSKNEIIQNPELSMINKIDQVLTVIPDYYRHINWQQVYMTKDKYPKLYGQIEKRLEKDKELTLALLEEGIKQGIVKPIALPVLKIIVEASIEQFLKGKYLAENNISYEEALKHLGIILMEGICIHE